MSLQLTTGLYVSDVDRAIRFYGTALGFEVLNQVPGVWALLGRNGSTLMVERPEGKAAATKEAVYLYVKVDNVAKDAARLRDAGIPFEGPNDKPYGMRELD